MSRGGRWWTKGRRACRPFGTMALRRASRERRHVAQERLDVQAAPCGLPDQRNRVQAPSVPVDVLGQPGLDRTDLATAQILFARSELGLHRLPQLRRDQAAQRVAWEVAEAARAPVDVLQAALCVRGHLDPEQPLHAIVPCGRQIDHRELAFDHRQLQFEAQDDVQRVRQWIGADPDERGFHRGQRGVQVGGREGEARPLELAREHLGERGAAGDVVLPELALGLVDRHRRPAPEVSPHQRGVYLALVETVAVLVQRAQQRLHVAVGVASRQARVRVPDPGGERVRRDVQSPALLIDAYSPQRVPDRRVLHVYRHRELATRRVGAHLLRERRQRSTEGAEQLPQYRGLQAEVVLGQQLLIWAGAALCQALSVLAREPHVALERGREACEIIVRPRAPPALLALGVGPGALGGEIRRYAARSLPLPSRHAHDVAVEIAQLRNLESGQPFPDLLAGRAFVRELRQRTQLVGPGL